MNNGFIKYGIMLSALMLTKGAIAQAALSFDGVVMPVVNSEISLPKQVTTWRLVKPWGTLVSAGDIILQYQVQVDPSDCIQWSKSYYQVQNELTAVTDPDKAVDYLELTQQWSEKHLDCERKENHLMGTQQLFEKGLVSLESYEQERHEYQACQNQEAVLKSKQQAYLDKMNAHQMSWYQSMIEQLDMKMKWCESPQKTWEWVVDSDGLLWPKEDNGIVLVDDATVMIQFFADEEDIKQLSEQQSVLLWFNDKLDPIQEGKIQSIGLKPVDKNDSFSRYVVQVKLAYPHWKQMMSEGEHVRVEVEPRG